MKPDWDRLMKLFDGSEDLLVADVDCTAEGRSMCSKNEIRSFPTIMYGEPGALQKYTGSRGFAELKRFAESLGSIPSGRGADEDEFDDLDDDLPAPTPTPPLTTTTTTTTTTQCFLSSLERCSKEFKEKIAEYRGWSLSQLESLIKVKAARKAKMEAEGKAFLEDQALRLLNEVHDEKVQDNLDRGEL